MPNAATRRLLIHNPVTVPAPGPAESIDSEIALIVRALATSPAAWPPMPSETTHNLESADKKYRSSLLLRHFPTSVTAQSRREGAESLPRDDSSETGSHSSGCAVIASRRICNLLR